MDHRGLLSFNLLLFLSLTSELSFGTDEHSLVCSTTVQRLGRNVMLPLIHKGINKTVSKSIRIVVTMGTSQRSVSQKKIMSFEPSEWGPPPNLEHRYKFHLENLSLEILGSKKEDEGWYSTSLEQNTSVQHFCLQLTLYEEVSTPEIMVLNSSVKSKNCNLTLACTVKEEDHVIYSWSKEMGVHSLSLANSSHLLYLTLDPQQFHNVYICTVSNPISNRSQTFNPAEICHPIPPGKTGHTQPTVEAKSLTIYAQVQNSGPVQKKLDTLPAQDPCTTIYVAATEPVPEPVKEPDSITVYASVTLPES
ncbi:signaling lymphocytic activation molecule [Rhynchocyon petersi]